MSNSVTRGDTTSTNAAHSLAESCDHHEEHTEVIYEEIDQCLSHK